MNQAALDWISNHMDLSKDSLEESKKFQGIAMEAAVQEFNVMILKLRNIGIQIHDSNDCRKVIRECTYDEDEELIWFETEDEEEED